MSSFISSPILYMGNKNRLIRRGLINLFPKNINHFIDAFAGSATVSMNTQA
ncbi:DNA adenine methylase, partial [Campylobacter coli]|nr:DNA adenine methylase [Campylobacter coli]